MSHSFAQLGIARQPYEPVGQVVRGARLHEEPVLALHDDVRNAPDPRGHDRPAGGERLDRAHGGPLVRRRQDEGVERSVERRDVLLVADEERLAHDAEVVRALLELRSIRPIADHAEHCVDAFVAQALERDEDVVRALHGSHASDPPDSEPIRLDAQVSPAVDAAVLFACDTLA